MDVIEISARETGLEVTIPEMCFVVEEYIKVRKGVRVVIGLTYRPQRILFRQLTKLHKAFDCASTYFLNQNK